MTRYTVRHGFELIAVFDADNIVRAIEFKQHLQRSYNRHHNCDEVFHVQPATPEEMKAVKEGSAVFLVPGGRKYRWS